MSEARRTLSADVALGRVPLSVIGVILVSIVLLMANATLLIINTGQAMESNSQYARSYEIKRALSGFQAVVTAAESGQRGYLLTGRDEYLEPFYLATRSWRTDIDRLRNLTADTPERQRDIAELQTLTASAISRLEQSIRRADQAGPNGGNDVQGTDRAKDSMDRVRAMITRLEEEEDQRIEALRSEVLRDMWVTVTVAVFTTIVTVAVLIGLQKLLQRHTAARAQAELALRESNLDLNRQVEQRTLELTELSQHLIRVSEEEKAKLARELHDTLGSNLTAINMDLNWLARRLPEEPRELRERLQRTQQMLAETVELKHQVIEGLRPSHLDNLGLAYAMHSHCREFTRRTGIPCEVEVSDDFDDLDPSWSIAFYRIVQEALTNITKHAQATEVHIELQREAEGIRLRITDNGIGIAEGSSSKPKSHGLVGMRERMRQIGGQLSVGRPPGGKGTTIEAFVPHLRESPPGNVGESLRAVG